MGSIPRGLPRTRHTGESRYPENQTGFRVKHGMTAKGIGRYPAACCGVVHIGRSENLGWPMIELADWGALCIFQFLVLKSPL